MSNRPHIVHILGTPAFGGAQKLVLDLVASPQLAEFRHSVVCILGHQGQILEQLDALGVPHYDCPARWPKMTRPSHRLTSLMRDALEFTFPYRLQRLLRRIDMDLMHSHVVARIGGQATTALELLQKGWLYTLHNMVVQNGTLAPAAAQALADRIAGKRAHIVGVSRAVAEDFTAQAPAAAGQVSVIYNGIHLDTFRQAAPALPGLRERFGIPGDAVVFGSAGRLVAQKRYDLLIEAAAEVAARSPKAYFMVAGDGPLREPLDALIRQRGLEARFFLAGYQSAIGPFLKELDVFVLSSAVEGLPMALLEACAAGLACIATDVGGNAEVLGRGRGLVVEAQSPPALSAAMLTLLDAETRQRCRDSAAAAAEGFTMDATAEQYRVLYRALT